MATLICKMDCANRSHQPLRKWRGGDGEKVYGCKLKTVVITRISDPDEYVVQVVGEDEMAHCPHYEPLNPVEYKEEE